MKKWLLLIIFTLFCFVSVAQLSSGDIAIIEYNGDNPDKIAFVALTDISSGTVIKFTDNGWKSNDTWRTGEGTHTWTASSDYSCGDVVHITLSGPALSTSGDQIIAYQGTNTFLYAVNNEGTNTWQADATSSNTSAIPMGLTNGTNAVALTEIDNAKYNGITTGTKAAILSAISDYTNWTGSNTVVQTFSGTFTISDCGTTPPVTTDAIIEIESILVDACIVGAGDEGENEMVRFRVDSASVPLSSLVVDWPNNSWLGLAQNTTTAGIVSDINSTVTAGGTLLEPSNDSIPANSIVMLISSTDFDYTAHDWSGLNFTMYAIFQDAGNTNGHFKNYATCASNCERTLIIDFETFDADTVNYDYNLLVGDGDGDGVDFDDPGNPTYSNCGCQAPYIDIQTLPVEMVYFGAYCNFENIIIQWKTVSETNNDYFIIQKTYNFQYWEEVTTIVGAGNSNSLLEYSYEYFEQHINDVYYRVTQVDFDGQSEDHGIFVVSCDNIISNINIYPNPANVGEEINIEGTFDSYVVYDIIGRECDLRKLKKGSYLLIIDKLHTFKIIIK